MSEFRKILPLVAVALLMFITACDRTTTYVTEDGTPQNCFSCHDDQNTFLIAATSQWENSFHASGLNIDRGSSSGCAGCHISEGFVQRANGEAVTGEENPTVIHCFTCHAPHTNGDFRLRWTENARLENGATYDLGAGNLCAACHIARRDVGQYVGSPGSTERVSISSTHWGPHHGPQGDVIIGSNGYEFDGYSYTTSPHRNNPNACLSCHFEATSNNIVGGHAFNMRGDARDEGGEFASVLNTAACAPCHGDLDDFDYHGIQTELLGLAHTLDSLLTEAGLVADGHPNSGAVTNVDSAGALWNFALFEDDRSWGVHNPKYFRGLLQSSIDYLTGNLPSSKPVATKEDDDEDGRLSRKN
jgi:hypothetical protein